MHGAARATDVDAVVACERLARVPHSTRILVAAPWLALGLACASHDGGNEAAIAGSAVEQARVSPAEAVCRHLVDLAVRRTPPTIDTGDEARVLAAIDRCRSHLAARVFGAGAYELRLQEDRDRCLLAASSQADLADCTLARWIEHDDETGRWAEVWRNLGSIAAAFERHILTREGAGPERYACPGKATGHTLVGPTPPLATACEGPTIHACRPVESVASAGDYPSALWRDDPMWRRLGVELDRPHRMHYALEFASTKPGGCQFTAQAFGDLDQDGVWSTFEFSGAVDQFGPNESIGLWFDHEDE